MNPLRKQQQPLTNQTLTIEIPQLPNALSLIERKDLQRCEREIRKSLKTFLRVARALLEIKERRLYRETYSSFEQYCEEAWGFQRHYAYRLLGAAEICAKMLPMGNTSPPENERQVRPLRGLSREKATEVWQRATELAGDRKITGPIVEKAVAEVCIPKAVQIQPKLAWQLHVEPLLKQALASTKRGERDQVEKMIQHVSLLLEVGQGPKLST